MKKITILLFLVALPVIASSQVVPKRKPGLWRMELESGMPGPAGAKKSQPMEQCIDEAFDQKMRTSMEQSQKVKCKKAETKTVTNGMTFDSECDFGGGPMFTHSEVQGDFNSKYVTKNKITFSAPKNGVKEVTTTVTATWLGPCKADQKPGDMMMPGGKKMNPMNPPPLPPKDAMPPKKM